MKTESGPSRSYSSTGGATASLFFGRTGAGRSRLWQIDSTLPGIFHVILLSKPYAAARPR